MPPPEIRASKISQFYEPLHASVLLKISVSAYLRYDRVVANHFCQSREEVTTEEDGQSLPRSKALGHQKEYHSYLNKDVLTHIEPVAST